MTNVIDKKSFFQKENIILYFDDFSSAYGKVKINNKDYFIAWKSDTLVPKTLLIKDRFLFIGIDQRVIVMDTVNNIILLSLPLLYNFSDVILHNRYILSFNESEVIVFNEDFSISTIQALPDIYENYETVENNKIKVKCLDGSEITINLIG